MPNSVAKVLVTSRSSLTSSGERRAEGVVASSVKKDLALSLIKEHGQLKEPISDLIRVRPTRAELQTILSKAAADIGMPQLTAQIDDNL